LSNKDNPYVPFSSKLEWEIARWAKFRGPSSTAVSELMGIEGVRGHNIAFYGTNSCSGGG
jgi:hypothetical protein